MEGSGYAPMRPSSEGPNPLRPYYKPPSIGLSHDAANASAKANSQNLGSGTRNILSDFNYNDILGEAAPTTGASLKSLLDRAVWKYSSVLMAQPFEVAKTVLQVHLASLPPASASRGSLSRQGSSRYQDYTLNDAEDDEDDDEPSYFTSSAPSQASNTRTPSSRHRSSTPRNPSQHSSDQPLTPSYKLELRKNDSLTEVLSQLWAREGSWGVWKGTNVTFLHSLLLKTIESWTRSMLSAVLNLPDPGLMFGTSGSVGGLDIIDSPSPFASLVVAVVASGIAGLVLAPLDIVRTRLILTPTVDNSRSILPCLRELDTWTCPASLFAPTLLHSTLPTFVSTTTPLFLRSYLRIDPIITPATYSVCTFISSTAELFLRLPIETVLRRGQMGIVLDQHAVKQGKTSRSRTRRSRGRTPPEDDYEEPSSKLETVVEIGPYTGVIATMWRIVRDEGESLEKVGETKGAPGPLANRPVHRPTKGQGLPGLVRGWRVGWWGLVGVWGAAALGAAGGKGGEF